MQTSIIKVNNTSEQMFLKKIHKCQSKECNLNDKIILEKQVHQSLENKLCNRVINSKIINVNSSYYMISKCSHKTRTIAIDLNSQTFIHCSNNMTFDLVKTKKYIYKYNKTKKEKYLRKVYNVRYEEINNICNFIIKNYDCIIIEDLGLVKKENDITKINNYVFSLFRSILISKTHLFSKKVILANKKFKSSKICYKCNKLNKINIESKIYKCKYCYNVINRDYNAALNLYNWGKNYD